MKALDAGADPVGNAPAAMPRSASGGRGIRRRADAYSRAVSLLKRVLPIIGALLLLLVAAWPRLAPLLENVRRNLAGIDLRAARELKMLNPRYAGTDRLNRPFVVTAAVGRQLPEHNDLMSLEKPRAVMIVHGGASVVLTAASAIYQSQPQLLDLFDNVVLTHQNGTRFVTQRAHADLGHDTAQGQVPIEGHGPSGDIWGQGFRVLDRGDTIVFTGRSRAILRGTKPVKPAATPSEPPAKVIETAATIEEAASGSDDGRPDLPAAKPAGAVEVRSAPQTRSAAANRQRPRSAGKTPARARSASRKTERDADRYP
jgi:lipopolysaccharide export system protein LptC